MDTARQPHQLPLRVVIAHERSAAAVRRAGSACAAAHELHAQARAARTMASTLRAALLVRHELPANEAAHAA